MLLSPSSFLQELFQVNSIQHPPDSLRFPWLAWETDRPPFHGLPVIVGVVNPNNSHLLKLVATDSPLPGTIPDLRLTAAIEIVPDGSGPFLGDGVVVIFVGDEDIFHHGHEHRQKPWPNDSSVLPSTDLAVLVHGKPVRATPSMTTGSPTSESPKVDCHERTTRLAKTMVESFGNKRKYLPNPRRATTEPILPTASVQTVTLDKVQSLVNTDNSLVGSAQSHEAVSLAAETVGVITQIDSPASPNWCAWHLRLGHPARWCDVR
jgi:hypothetical protein